MQIEDLIERVLEEIKKQEKTKENRKEKSENNPVKMKMVIIGDDLSYREEIKRKYETTYDLEFMPCFDCKTEFDRLLLAQITPNTLQKLALAMDPTIGPVMETLMKGKEVLYLKEGLFHEQCKETCPKGLYKTYEESVKKMVSYGILEDNLQVKKPDKKHEGRVDKRKLITEKEVKALVANGDVVLRVQPNTLITPLAKDLMKEYHIMIEKQEGGISHANS